MSNYVISDFVPVKKCMFLTLEKNFDLSGIELISRT